MALAEEARLNKGAALLEFFGGGMLSGFGL
jgi:hypothetical protein